MEVMLLPIGKKHEDLSAAEVVIRMGVRKVLIMESRKVEKWKTRTLPNGPSPRPPYREGVITFKPRLRGSELSAPRPIGRGRGRVLWGWFLLYRQLTTPSEVSRAVRAAITIWTMALTISFFIFIQSIFSLEFIVHSLGVQSHLQCDCREYKHLQCDKIMFRIKNPDTLSGRITNAPEQGF